MNISINTSKKYRSTVLKKKGIRKPLFYFLCVSHARQSSSFATNFMWKRASSKVVWRILLVASVGPELHCWCHGWSQGSRTQNYQAWQWVLSLLADIRKSSQNHKIRPNMHTRFMTGTLRDYFLKLWTYYLGWVDLIL